MGTRGLIGTIHDGELHGSYNHFDMYPTGVGRSLQNEILALLARLSESHADPDTEAFWSETRPMVARMRYVNSDETPTAEELDHFAGSHDKAVSAGNDWYAVLRGHHGSLLQRLEAGVATEDTEFLQSSLFCEWVYIFDYDEKKVLILKGFNKDPKKEWPRAAVDVSKWEPRFEGDKLKYFGCTLAWEGPLGDFLTLDMEKFEESLNGEEAA